MSATTVPTTIGNVPVRLPATLLALALVLAACGGATALSELDRSPANPAPGESITVTAPAEPVEAVGNTAGGTMYWFWAPW